MSRCDAGHGDTVLQRIPNLHPTNTCQETVLHSIHTRELPVAAARYLRDPSQPGWSASRQITLAHPQVWGMNDNGD